MTTTCTVCPFECRIRNGKFGYCRVRKNVGGKIVLTNRNFFSTVIVGPVEQKPIYHYKPGSKVLSIGTVGCNLRCKYCQNFEVSQVSKANSVQMTPKEVVELALKKEATGIVYTYNEPLIWYETVLEVAEEAKKAGLSNLLKTNGFASTKVFRAVADKMDAINIDIKGDFSLYYDVCGISFDSTRHPSKWQIIKNLNYAYNRSSAVCEVSIILIPGYEKGLKKMLPVIRKNTHKDTAIHILKFIPDFKMKNVPPASALMLEEAKNLALSYFDNVYIDFAGEDCNTKCLWCSKDLVRRSGIKLLLCNVDGKGCCSSCGNKSPIRMT
jgi:pyruvate formate lyase activating enzyme